MDSRIQIRKEGKRGCGFRNKKGALYLVDLDPANFRQCGKLPFALGPCPVCGEGIRPSRQWVWVEADAVLASARKKPCAQEELDGCPGCPLDLAAKIGKAGLLWIGDKYYTPASFTKEAKAMGISRRVAFVPKGFQVGKTWVLLAHIRAVHDGSALRPGIVTAFQPKAIEIICDGKESAEEIQAYEVRGLTPVFIDNGGVAAVNDGESVLEDTL